MVSNVHVRSRRRRTRKGHHSHTIAAKPERDRTAAARRRRPRASRPVVAGVIRGRGSAGDRRRHQRGERRRRVGRSREHRNLIERRAPRASRGDQRTARRRWTGACRCDSRTRPRPGRAARPRSSRDPARAGVGGVRRRRRTAAAAACAGTCRRSRGPQREVGRKQPRDRKRRVQPAGSVRRASARRPCGESRVDRTHRAPARQMPDAMPRPCRRSRPATSRIDGVRHDDERLPELDRDAEHRGRASERPT